MSITKEVKQSLIEDFRSSEKDTGSPEVQCAILTHRIQTLTVHLKVNQKDFQSRRGLIAMVNQRKRLLKYLKKHDLSRHMEILARLGLKK
ncbi:30S ribosomal subunit protein S15 [Alphaproteobacteria bacterium]